MPRRGSADTGGILKKPSQPTPAGDLIDLEGKPAGAAAAAAAPPSSSVNGNKAVTSSSMSVASSEESSSAGESGISAPPVMVSTSPSAPTATSSPAMVVSTASKNCATTVQAGAEVEVAASAPAGEKSSTGAIPKSISFDKAVFRSVVQHFSIITAFCNTYYINTSQTNFCTLPFRQESNEDQESNRNEKRRDKSFLKNLKSLNFPRIGRNRGGGAVKMGKPSDLKESSSGGGTGNGSPLLQDLSSVGTHDSSVDNSNEQESCDDILAR